tara:strand:- start:23 stop:151 length:129 start_codon:yes stop_codon:yes gene_type:complete
MVKRAGPRDGEKSITKRRSKEQDQEMMKRAGPRDDEKSITKR